MASKDKAKYLRLSTILIKNNKVVFVISFIATIMGFTFLLTFSSLSETIIETRQNEAANTYGRFLVVASDISDEQIEYIKKGNTRFDYSLYEVTGNVQYGTKTITMGNMEEKLGRDLGFELLEGRWSSSSHEIVIEEYLKSLFNIEHKSLPCTISLENNGERKDYTITGIISNYSSMLSVCDYLTIDTNVYPSIIFGDKIEVNEKKSLIIKQKKLNYKAVDKDIYSITSMLSIIEPAIENVSANEKLYEKGYMDNEDIINLKIVYQIILNILLVLEQVMILRYFLIKNKKSLYLFQALGLSEMQKRKGVFGVAGGNIFLSLIISYIITFFIGIIFINDIFEGYNNYYIYSLRKYFVIECIVITLIVIGACITMSKNKKSSIMNELVGNNYIHRKTYKFKKIDWCIIFMQIICMFFIMATINFSIMFKLEEKDIQCTLYSKSTGVSQPMRGYNISENGEKYFSFDSISQFKEYESYINVSMDGETKYGTIILDKECKDKYFSQSYFEEQTEMDQGDQELNKQIPKEAEKYKVIPDSYVNIKILPRSDFVKFLKENNIENANLENEKEDSCILILPDYDVSDDKAVIKENGIIQLGRIEYDKENLVFNKHQFRVEKLLAPKNCDDIRIQLVMSEGVARKIPFIIGYDKIWITIDKECPVSFQKIINSEMALLMASLQGGRLDSSVRINQNNLLMEKYSTLLSKSVLLFSVISICIYILLNSYINWEKNKHEYGVLRSIGMSYSMLQHKLFVRYSNSIVIAAIIAVFIGKEAFPNGELKLWQIGISVVVIIVITCICGAYIYK